MSSRLNQGHYIAIAITLIVSAWMIQGLISKPAPEPAKAPVTLQPDALFSVQVQSVTAQTIHPEITINGHTSASQSVLLSAETAGKVIAIHKKEGQRVNQGDIILELDPQDKNERLLQAQSIVKQREMELEGSKTLSAQGLQNQSKLVEAQAALAAAKADARSLQVQLAATKIKAPFNGILEDRKVELGAYVRVGDTIISLLNYSPFIISGEVPEKDLMALHIGQEAQGIINLQSYHGKLRYIASRATTSTRAFSVELEINNPSARMAEGLTATIRVQLPATAAIKISPALLSLNKEGLMGLKYVDAQQTVQFAPINLIKAEADGIWVAGLPNPVNLIMVGQSFVSTGQQVNAVQATTTQNSAE
jgi:membrane fusion protein, multidrug efflux system